MTQTSRRRSNRATFIRGAAIAGTGLALAGAELARGDNRPAQRPSRAPAETIRSVLNALLDAERLAITLYFTALTTPAVLHSRRLGGGSADPNNPGRPPNGAPEHVRYLQAALDAEVKHASALAAAGASSPYTRFYFPASTFRHMGTSTDPDSFLGVVNMLETTCVGVYVAAAQQFAHLDRPDLATVAAQIMGVECEHRTLGRVIADVNPPNNLTLELAPFVTVSDAVAVLRSYLTGKGFARGVTAPIALPTHAQTTRVIGKYGTRLVMRYV